MAPSLDPGSHPLKNQLVRKSPSRSRLRVAKDLLPALRGRELATVATRLAAETGLTYRPVQEGQRASGIYRQAVPLVSGKYAMLADGVGFSLVPWRPDLERSIRRGVGMPGPRRGIGR